MRLRLVLALVFLFLAVMAFGAEVHASIRAGGYGVFAVGDLWAEIDAEGLDGARGAVRGSAVGAVAGPVMAGGLALPLWLPFLALAGLFLWLDRRPHRGRKRRIFR